MIRFTRTQIQPIGLDIGRDSIKMMQLEVVGDSLSVVAAAKQPWPEEIGEDPHTRTAVAGELIRQLLRRGDFSGRRVVAALPRESLHVKNIRLPMMPAHEMDSVVKFEAQNIFGFHAEEAQVHHLMAGEVRQGPDVRQEVMVLAARNGDVSHFVEQLHHCGADVESLDSEPCALYRSVERFVRRREDEQEVYVLLDVGERRSQVVIGRGREISFYKPIEIGARDLHEAVSRKLGIAMEEARALRRRLIGSGEAEGDPVLQAAFDAARSRIEDLAAEISLCLRYYVVTFRGQRPQRIRLVGGEAHDRQLLSVLSASLMVPVVQGRPLYNVDCARLPAEQRRGPMCEWALALGLGLKRTRGRFAARDGKPRDPDEAVDEETSAVEVVDLKEAVHA